MLITIICYFILILLIGFFAARKVKGSEGFYLGGKRFGPWFTSFKFAATLESGTKLVGTPGMAWAAGYPAFLQGMFTPLTYLLSFRVFGQRLKTACDYYNVLTVPQLLEKRYNDRFVRVLASIAVLVGLCGTLIVQLKATGEIFSSLLNINYIPALLIGSAVVGLYCVVGGYLASVWTDFMQGIVMAVGSIILFFATMKITLGEISLNFLSELNMHLAEINPAMLTIDAGGKVPITMVIIMTIIGFIMGIALPQQAVAIFSMRDKRVARTSIIICTVFSTILLWTIIPAALMGKLILDPSLIKNPDMVMPLLTKTVLPPAIAGLFLAGILAAIMSTIDGVVVVASSAITQDIMSIVANKTYSKNQIAWDRAATAFLVIMCIIIAIKPPAIIFWITIFAFGFTVFTFVMPMIGVVLWKRATAKAAIIQMITVMIVIPVWQLVGVKILPNVPGLLVGLILAPIVFIIASIITKQDAEEFQTAEDLWKCYKSQGIMS